MALELEVKQKCFPLQVERMGTQMQRRILKRILYQTPMQRAQGPNRFVDEYLVTLSSGRLLKRSRCHHHRYHLQPL
jgi:hypothetical protein